MGSDYNWYGDYEKGGASSWGDGGYKTASSKKDNGYLDTAVAIWDWYDRKKRNKKQDRMMEESMKPIEYKLRPDLQDPWVKENRDNLMAQINERDYAKLLGGMGGDWFEHFGGGERKTEDDGRIMYTPSSGKFATADRVEKWKKLFQDFAMPGTPDAPLTLPTGPGSTGTRTGPHTDESARDAWTTPDGQEWDAPVVRGDNLDPNAWKYSPEEAERLAEFIKAGGAGANQGFTGNGDDWFGMGGAIAEGRAMDPYGEVDVRMVNGKPVFKQSKPRWDGGGHSGTEPARESGFDSWGDTMRGAPDGEWEKIHATGFRPFYKEDGTWDLPFKDGTINLSEDSDSVVKQIILGSEGDTTGAKVRNRVKDLAEAAVRYGGGPIGFLALKALRKGAEKGYWGWDEATGTPYWGKNKGDG